MPLANDEKLKSKMRRFKRGKKCFYCEHKLPADLMTVDHAVPRAFYEDAYDTRNWQIMCLRCHRIKSSMEARVLTGQYKAVPPIYFKNLPGLALLRDTVIRVEDKLGYPHDKHRSFTGEDFKTAGETIVFKQISADKNCRCLLHQKRRNATPINAS